MILSTCVTYTPFPKYSYPATSSPTPILPSNRPFISFTLPYL